MNGALSALFARLRAFQSRLECSLLRAYYAWTFRAPSGPSALPPRPASILVLLPDEIGDMILALPLLRALRRGHPNARLTLLAQAVPARLALSLGLADEVATLKGGRPWFPALQAAWRAWRACRTLKGRRFDWALFPNSGADRRQASLAVVLAPAAFRVGMGADESPERAAWDCLPARAWNLRVAPAGVHEGDRLAGFAAALGLPVAKPSDRLLSDARLRRGAARRLSGFGPGSWLAVAPFARSGRRAWPLERWAHLARELARESGLRPLVFAGPGEARRARLLACLIGEGTPVFADLKLREGAALLSRARLCVGADSAAVHLAAAEGRPCLVVNCHPLGAPAWHANAPERFGPLGVRAFFLRPAVHAWPCSRGCDAFAPHCILGLDAAQASASAVAWVRTLDRTKPARFPGPRRAVRVFRKGAKP